MDLENTVAVVTGAGSGLGLATASALARRGAYVVGIDLPVALDGVTTDGVEYVGADVTQADQVTDAIERAAERGVLRTVVSCAGIAPAARLLSRDGESHDLELFRRVIAVNLVGTFAVMSVAARAIARAEPLADGQRGVIINTASIAAFEGQMGQSAYAASKGAVAALTLPAARDLADRGIRVCAIAPGIVDTPMMASFSTEVRSALSDSVPFPKRLAKPAEFAELALSIVDHDYLNGEVIRLDGALRMAAR